MPKKREPDGGVPRDWSAFPGFYPPRYTPTPDALFDWVMAGLNGAELKLVLAALAVTAPLETGLHTVDRPDEASVHA